MDDVDEVALLDGSRVRTARRRARRRGLVLSTLVAATLVAGLTWWLAAPWDSSRATRSDVATSGGRGIPRLVEVPCPPTALCIWDITVDGATYASSCDPVAADLVSDDVLGEGLLEGAPTQARRIQGVDPVLIVALRRPSDWCTGQEGSATVTWSLAYAAPGPTDAELRLRGDQATCRVVPPEGRGRYGCPGRRRVPGPLMT